MIPNRIDQKNNLCKIDLPQPFCWKIKCIGKCMRLNNDLAGIMHLSEVTDNNPDLTVMPRAYYDSLPEDERNEWITFYSRKAVRIFHDSKLSQWFMVIPEDIIPDYSMRIVMMWLMMRVFLLHCLSQGALPVHASSAEFNGKGIIVASSGDTGKTTTVRRLPHPWREIADDNVLILPCKNGFSINALPTWSEFIHGRDKSASWNIKEGKDLKAIFFLEQSDHDESEPLSKSLSTMRLHQFSEEAIGELKNDISSALRSKIFETSADVIAKTPTFSLKATLNGKIWESIENALHEGSE